MTANKKAASPVQADHLGENAIQNQDHITTLISWQVRIISAWSLLPEGLLSSIRRRASVCMNIDDVVMVMRRRGYNITCAIEPFTTQDGVRARVGKDRLMRQGREAANG